MPFGTELQEDGRVRFHLWAPGARHVALLIEDEPEPVTLDMAAEADGWFGIVTAAAATGSLYRFRADDGPAVPDPASRFQPDDVHRPSAVVDPCVYAWDDGDWTGRPWAEAVIYEFHVGTFTPAGTFAAAAERLDHLAELGVTAVELMPVADFPGRRNWGYDGVLPFAPDSAYGRPEDLKAFVDAAHRRGLMVLLDVVYNHFGPDGNFLAQYAPQFFTERHHTPWGAAINYDGPGRDQVRAFIIHNTLYWLEEYHLDGLRLDAVDTIMDDSRPDILEELADHVRRTVDHCRHVHLVLENDRNEGHYLERAGGGAPRLYDAQWNEDAHHAAHVLVTGEHEGYYRDYADEPAAWLGRTLAEGFGYQGERSAHRGGRARGTPSAHLPPTAFVTFLQNHDQIGNRPLSERITDDADAAAVRALTGVLLLAPAPPLLFMGQEWAAAEPFPFFCDFDDDLNARVAAGRRDEFAAFPGFTDPASRARIPAPGDAGTFQSAVLDWSAPGRAPHADWLAFHRQLLGLRHREIVPRLTGMTGGGTFTLVATHTLRVDWPLGDGSELHLLAHLDAGPGPAMAAPPGRMVYALGFDDAAPGDERPVPPWSVQWSLAGPPPATP